MTKIRDIIHGYIPIEEEDEKLVDCHWVQRLRYIKQNDLDFLVFPTLNTSRFEHSLGVMHLAGQIAETAIISADVKIRRKYLRALGDLVPVEERESKISIDKSFRRAARWYGLLHDVGHLPFSHLTEQALVKMYGGEKEAIAEIYPEEIIPNGFKKPHEATGRRIVFDQVVGNALGSDKQAAWMVKKLMSMKEVTGQKLNPLVPLKNIVDSEVDADRIDSTARDGYLSGGDFGNYDIQRLIQSARLVSRGDGWEIMFSTHAIGPIEGLLMERYKTYRWIHFHHKVTALRSAFGVCIENLGWSAKSWGQVKYFDERTGFLDDATIMRALWNMPLDLPKARYARNAVLLREELCYPLWKRYDGFHLLCGDVAKGLPEKWKMHAAKGPILNILAIMDHETKIDIEEELNNGAPCGVNFLITGTRIKLIETEDQCGVQTSKCHIYPENGDAVPLSEYSGIVASLKNITEREPMLSVCVLGKVDEIDRAKVRKHFVSASRDLIKRCLPNPG